MPFPSVNEEDFPSVDPVFNHSVAKRKRQAPSISSISNSISSTREPATLETTPNPKPRKQTKHILSSASRASNVGHEPTTPTKSSPSKARLLQSPHTDNPHADYLPPMLSFKHERVTAKRRSATPVPPYEPPAERFTPPREVLYTPSPVKAAQIMSKSSKRKTALRPSTTKAKVHVKGKKLVLMIKKEPPDIDLSLPLPPPSPTDDPLLLSGTPGRKRSKAKRRSFVDYARDTPSIQSTSPVPVEDDHHEPQSSQVVDVDADLPPSSPIAVDSDEDDPPLPMINLQEAATPGTWSDDDDADDGFDQEGEYTGRYKTVVVPTKADPPSSCTRERMDAWGHPKSPFPYARSHGRSSSRSSMSPTPQSSGGGPITEVYNRNEADEEVGAENQPQTELQVTEVDEEIVDDARSPTPTQATPRATLANDADGNLLPGSQQDRGSSVNPFNTSPRKTWLSSARLNWSPNKVSNELPLGIQDVSGLPISQESLNVHDAQIGDVIMNEDTRSTDTILPQPGSAAITTEVQPSQRVGSTTGDRPSSATIIENEYHPTEELLEDNDKQDAEDVDRELSTPPEPDRDDDDHIVSGPHRSDSVPRSEHQDADVISGTDASPRRTLSPVHKTLIAEETANIMRLHNNTSAQVGNEYDDEVSDEGEVLDEDVIRITSNDPRAAARAAAILKMVSLYCAMLD